MKEKVYNLYLTTDLKLIKLISQLDRFDASWASLEKTEGDNLKQLRTFATIQSIGASTRIEGSELSDVQIEALLNNIDISKLEDRDAQEAVGYSKALNLIIESFEDIEPTERDIKNLHNILMQYSEKDQWHRGNYKKHVNAVEATFPDGTKQIIFRTTEPGIATEDAMRLLTDWYNSEKNIPAIIKIAAFVYDFLSIHPFQDGNGRLSRLLTTFLLLKSGYTWIQYISLEHEIENNKKNYYLNLRSCQSQRPNEDITEWVFFLIKSLVNVQIKLENKIKLISNAHILYPKEKAVYTFIMNNPGCKAGDIIQKVMIPSSTTKKILSDLVSKKLIERHGNSAGTNYSVIA